MDGEAIQKVIDEAKGNTLRLVPITAPVDVQGIPNEVDVIMLPIGEGRMAAVGTKSFLDEWRTTPERRSGTARAAS